jgi:hypothetical protein
MSNALMSLEPKDLSELKGVAQVFAESGIFSDARSMAQAFVKIMAGRELGFGAFASMNGINIIQGKPAMGANLIAAAIKRHNSPRYDYRVDELTDDKCVISFYQDGELVGNSVFTNEDARKAQLLNKDNWKKNPRNMLFARAISNGARWFCPDVFGGPVYTPEEMGTEDDGDVIDGVIVDSPQDEPPTPQIAPKPEQPRRMPFDNPPPPVEKPEARDAEYETPPAAKEEADFLNNDAPFNAKTLPDMIAYTIEHSEDIATGDKYHGGGRLYKAVTGKDGKPTWTPSLFKELALNVGQAKSLVDSYIAEKEVQPALLNDKPADKVVGGSCKSCGDPTSRKDLIGEWFCEDCAIELAEQAHADVS